MAANTTTNPTTAAAATATTTPAEEPPSWRTFRGVCKDYQKYQSCARPSSCEYFHLITGEYQENLPLCKDFQNRGCCGRRRCHFLHFTHDEEENYRDYGEIPPHRGNPEKVIAMKKAFFADRPDVCEDYLNNVCDKGWECRFQHIQEYAYQMDVMEKSTAGVTAAGYSRRNPQDFIGFVKSASEVNLQKNNPKSTDVSLSAEFFRRKEFQARRMAARKNEQPKEKVAKI